MYLLVLFLSTLPAVMVLAQTTNVEPAQNRSEYQQAADNAFANLDKGGITSGILYDRVFSAANLREPGAVSSPGHFQQAQSELYEASYNRNERLTPEDLSSLIWESEQRGITPIGVLLANVQVVNFDAIELDGNNQYRLRNGYNNSQLYQTHEATVTSVLSASVGRGTSLFQLPQWATYSHHNEGITSVVIDFGDGNPVQTLTPGDATVPVYYGSEGEKTIRYTINLADGTQRTATSTLRVNNLIGGVTNGTNNAVTSAYPEPPPSDGFGRIERVSIESDESFQGYDESNPSKGKGNAYFYYAQGRNQIRKPVVVMDGFDANDERGPQKIYDENLRYIDQNGQEQLLGNEFRRSDPAYQNRPDYNSDLIILNFPKYEYARETKNVCLYNSLIGCLFRKTVSVPRIRDGGVDYIERNGLVLEKLLKVVNERLSANGSTEKITLIGPSMGGLISRYALRHMESRGENTNCKLWVSFDSPHNGANIPIGEQQFLNFYANGLGVASAKDALRSQIDSPASKQMLIHHYRNGESIGGAPGFRDRFVSTLNTLGYPQSPCTRKVALSNGSKNGTLQSFGACQEGFYLRARLTNLSTTLCFAVALLSGGIFGPIGAICAVGRDRLLESRVYTAPSGSDRCLTMRTTVTSFGAGISNGYAIGRGGNQPSNDLLPGGKYPALQELGDEAREKNWFYRIDVSPYFPKASFIPTVSSFGLYNTDRNWGASLNGINIQNETPFAAIHAPDDNEDHVQLTQASVNFTRAQIALANEQCDNGSCNFNVSANTVSAGCNQQVTLTATCNGSNCDGVTYVWSGPNNFNASGSSVNVTPTASNGSYAYTVTASRANCSNKTATSTVNVSGCGGGETPGGSLTPGCYVIKSQKTGQSLQAMSDGFINQQGGNGQNNQVWKAEEVGGGQFRFTTQDGTNRVIKTNTGGYGDRLVLTAYTGEDVQKWSVAQNGNSGNYRVARSNGTTWDLSNYGNSAELQLWGSTSEPFYDYRSFRFESAGCSGTPLPPNCDFTISANTVNAGCNQQVQLTASCNGANCDGISYSWTGNGLNQNGQSVSFNAPGSNGGFTYTVTASRSGCSAKTATGTVNVSGCGGGTGGGSLTPGCYVIKSQKMGQSLQAMDDGSIKQQGSNGQANQVWKAEDVGSSQYRFTTQNGSNQVIKANDGNNYGEQLSLGGYTGDERQRWAVQQDGGSGNYRVYRSNGITWDLNNFGNNPELQLWGSTSDPFYDYRSFRFESAGCSGTPPPPPPPGGGSLAFQIVSYDCNSGLLQYRFNSSDGSAVSVNLPGIFGGTVSPNTVLSYTFPGDGLQGRTVTGTATQSGTQISINFTNGCGLSGGRQASLDAGSPAVGDGLATTLLVSPNPAHGAATARFRLALGETATLSVVNLLGKVLHRKAVVGTGDEQTERIELEHQAAGIYLVRLSTGKASYIARVVLER